MRYLFIDFETRSKLSLSGPSSVGAHAYAEHPSTSVMCMAWALDDGPVHLWRPNHGDSHEWEVLLEDQSIIKVAHNCEFERAIFRHKLRLDTPIEEWDDTAARCARISLPRKLEDAAIALRLPVEKDMEGNRVMMKLSKPRKPSRSDPSEWWTPETKPDDFRKLYDYCKQDVVVMRQVHRVVPPLSERERRIWISTVRANERGIKVDVPGVRAARKLANKIEAGLIAEFTALTGANPNSAVAAAAALGLPDFTEDTVRRALTREDLDPKTRRALEVRQLQAYSSLKKLDAFLNRVSSDGRLRGSMIYSGAERTQRWSSGGVQIQNVPAPKGVLQKRFDEAFEALGADCLDLIYDDVLGTLSGMLRGFMQGPFLVGDYAQVEARNTAWLAGQDDLVEAFAKGSDPYKQMASIIYHVPFDKIIKPQREVGKRAILGCGYGMGPDKFKESLEVQYGIKIDAALAERTVQAYRRTYAKIPKLWYTLGDGFAAVIRRGYSRLQVGPVEMGMTEIAGHPFAYIRLPSNRALFYGWPEVRDVKGRPTCCYYGRNLYLPGKQWGMVSTWGGKITENIVQALSRDLLADAILRTDEAGLPLAMTVHDETVVEAPISELQRFERLLMEKAEWAKTIPVGVECFATERYRK